MREHWTLSPEIADEMVFVTQQDGTIKAGKIRGIRLELSDGSVVDLNTAARVEVLTKRQEPCRFQTLFSLEALNAEARRRQ